MYSLVVEHGEDGLGASEEGRASIAHRAGGRLPVDHCCATNSKRQVQWVDFISASVLLGSLSWHPGVFALTQTV